MPSVILRSKINIGYYVFTKGLYLKILNNC